MRIARLKAMEMELSDVEMRLGIRDREIRRAVALAKGQSLPEGGQGRTMFSRMNVDGTHWPSTSRDAVFR